MASAAGSAAAPTSRSLSGSAQAAGAREVGSSARIGEVQIAIAFASHGPLRNCPGCALQTLRSRYPRTKGVGLVRGAGIGHTCWPFSIAAVAQIGLRQTAAFACN